MNDAFKARLARIKSDYGLTQEEIANGLGLSRTYLSAVVGGKYPYSESLKIKIEGRFPLRGEDEEKGVPDEKMVTIPASTLETLTETINRLTEVNLSQQKDISRLLSMIAPEVKQNVG